MAWKRYYSASDLLRSSLGPEDVTSSTKEVKYLGHVVIKRGISIDPDKVKVKEWDRSTNLTNVKSSLGFVGYYRKFFKNFLPPWLNI